MRQIVSEIVMFYCSFIVHTRITFDSFLNGVRYEDLAISMILMTLVTPGWTNCVVSPDRSSHLALQNAISSSGPELSALSIAS